MSQKLLIKGCITYLAYIIDSGNEEMELTNITIVREFPFFSSGVT